MSEFNGHSEPGTEIHDSHLMWRVERHRSILPDPGSINFALEHVKPADFFREPHQHIFEALCELYMAFSLGTHGCH